MFWFAVASSWGGIPDFQRSQTFNIQWVWGLSLELEHSDGEHHVKICQNCNYSAIHIISLIMLVKRNVYIRATQHDPRRSLAWHSLISTRVSTVRVSKRCELKLVLADPWTKPLLKNPRVCPRYCHQKNKLWTTRFGKSHQFERSGVWGCGFFTNSKFSTDSWSRGWVTAVSRHCRWWSKGIGR